MKCWLGIVAVLGDVLASVLCMAPVRSLVADDDASGDDFKMTLTFERGGRAEIDVMVEE